MVEFRRQASDGDDIEPAGLASERVSKCIFLFSSNYCSGTVELQECVGGCCDQVWVQCELEEVIMTGESESLWECIELVATVVIISIRLALNASLVL